MHTYNTGMYITTYNIDMHKNTQKQEHGTKTRGHIRTPITSLLLSLRNIASNWSRSSDALLTLFCCLRATVLRTIAQPQRRDTLNIPRHSVARAPSVEDSNVDICLSLHQHHHCFHLSKLCSTRKWSISILTSIVDVLFFGMKRHLDAMHVPKFYCSQQGCQQASHLDSSADQCLWSAAPSHCCLRLLLLQKSKSPPHCLNPQLTGLWVCRCPLQLQPWCLHLHEYEVLASESW